MRQRIEEEYVRVPNFGAQVGGLLVAGAAVRERGSSAYRDPRLRKDGRLSELANGLGEVMDACVRIVAQRR